MTFSVAIRTVPIRSELFSSLLQELHRMWTPSVQGLHVSSNEKVSPNENACAALQRTVVDTTDWVIFLEDDAGPIEDFFGSVERWLAKYQRDNVHVYPLGCQYSKLWSKGTEVWEYPIPNFYCSVAMVIRASYVPSLITFIRGFRVTQGFDILTGEWHQSISDSQYFLTPVPCFIEHLGDSSTLAANRPAKNVVGRFTGFAGKDYVYRG